MKNFSKVLEFKIYTFGDYSLYLGQIVSAFIILLTTLIILRLLKHFFINKNRFKKIEQGNLSSLFQIIRYVIWTISWLLVFETLGLKLNILLASSAALLVGLGLGLQNTFNDFISGIIILLEGSIHVGDILEIDNDILEIRRIGLRTSEALNRDDIFSIIPNSQILQNRIINWSHQSKKARFRIKVGVAYGSDIDIVLKLLKESAMEHPDVINKELVYVRFIDFGNSSLDFELLFFSGNIFRIENLKSDIRIRINKKFIANNINIPFPQMDVHLKKEE